MDKTPGYWRWIYHITREWDYPDAREAAKVIGFSIIMSTFGKNGRSIRPAAHTIARRAGMTDKLARHYRQRCVELGLFTDTGRKYNCIPVLDISIPGKADGLSTRGIAEAVNVSKDTVARELARVSNETPEIRGKDGKTYPASRVPAVVSGEVVDDEHRAFDCGRPGCTVPVWHEHRTEEPTARERQAADDETG